MNDADRCILDHFAGVRNRTIELAERIPAELLERTPPGEHWSLFWHLVHIADGPDWWMTHVLKDGGTWQWSPPYASGREGLLRGLAASRDRVVRFFAAEDGRRMAETFAFTEGDGSASRFIGRDRVLYLTDHDTHHRGRILLALMQWGFEDLPGDENLWPPTA